MLSSTDTHPSIIRAAGERLRKPVLFLAVVAAAILLVGCAGGGSSTEAPTVAGTLRPHESEAEPKPSATKIARQERRTERRNEKYRQKEEARIRHEEAEHRAAAKKRQKHRQPKPAPSVPAPADSPIDPVAAEELHNFKGTDRSNWEIAFGVCAVTPEKQLAREFHTEQNWAAIGHAYGSGYREPFNIAAEEGCMVALKDDHAQREAAFALMEENE